MLLSVMGGGRRVGVRVPGEKEEVTTVTVSPVTPLDTGEMVGYESCGLDKGCKVWRPETGGTGQR